MGFISEINTGPNRLKDKSPEGFRGLLKWIRRQLSSINTSLYILGVLALFFVVGTIFPQGGGIEDYRNAGGRFFFLVETFSLLDLFASPLFLIAAFILFLNLAVCTWDRYAPLFAKKSFPREFSPTHTFELPGKTDPREEAQRILKDRLGFRVVSSDGDRVVMEKGIPYKWLTWIYHAGIILCFAGFLVSYLFAFEDEIKLRPGRPETIAPKTVSKASGLLNKTAEKEDFQLVLDEFLTEHAQSPRLNYPKDKISRLAMALGWKMPEYELKDDSFFPKDWKSRLRVVQGGKTVLEKTIEVNDPLRYGGYTFYQADFEQRLKIRMDESPFALDAKAGEELIAPGLDSTLKFGSLRTGTLFKLDGTTEKLRAFVTVKRVLKEPVDGKNSEDLGKLELDSSLVVDGHMISLAGFEETSVLTYRHDPGVTLLWWAGIIVLAAMALRFYGSWYMIFYTIDHTGHSPALKVHIRAKGLGADAEKLAKRIGHYIGAAG